MKTNLDKTLAILGLLISLALAIWLAMTAPLLYVIPPILAFLTCVSYLIIRNRLPSFISLSQSNNRLYIITNILYLVFLSGSTILLYLRPEVYVRPLGYFILMALMVSVLAVEILFCVNRKQRVYFALFKIILIPLSLEWSQLLIFPSVIGADPWYHQLFTLDILRTGHIIEGSAYSELPIMHLLIGSTSLITGLNYKMAAMLSVSLLQVVCDLSFVFLIGRFIYGAKVGLLAALLLGVGSQHLLYGIWAIPNTFGVPLILITIYLLLKMRARKPTLAILLSVLFLAILILTHTISSLAMIVILLAFWIGFVIHNKVQSKNIPNLIPLDIVTLFLVSAFSWWIYVSGHIGWIAEWLAGDFGRESFGELGIIPWNQYIFGVPFGEQLFSYLGFFLFLALSLAGCLYMVSQRFSNRYSFAMAIVGTMVLTIGFIPFIFGISVIAGRWWYFSQVMLAVPLGVALLLFCEIIKNNLIKTSSIAILTFLLTLLMIMSPTANQDNRIFSPNLGVRNAFIESEIQSVNTNSNIWRGKIGTAFLGRLRDMPGGNLNIEGIAKGLYDRDFSDSKYEFILMSKEITEYAFLLDGATYRLDYNAHQLITELGFNKIYDCGSVSSYYRPVKRFPKWYLELGDADIF